MGKETGIAWTDHTFNPWRGCEKVSEGCKHCYAETFVVKRQGLPVWGAQAERKVAAESTWKNLLKWNREAERDGVKRRVFVASLADIFEDYQGPSAEEVRAARFRLITAIGITPNLIYLLLTKRPQNVARLWPPHLPGVQHYENIWIGCTVENQKRAEERLPHLLKIPAAVRFVSYEPALEAVDFAPWLPSTFAEVEARRVSGQTFDWCDGEQGGECWCRRHSGAIDWLIVGGESGGGARPFDVAWARLAVEQCTAADVPVFVKQLGAVPVDSAMLGSFGAPAPWPASTGSRASYPPGMALADKKGGDMAEWPEDLRVREFPNA